MSNSNDDFYIGYFPKAPNSFKKAIRGFLVLLAIAIPLISFLISSNQQGFPDSTFELGKLTVVEGVLSTNPVPMLKVIAGEDMQGRPVYQSILLIGFGKFGAEPTLEKMATKHGESIEGKRLKLEGTLIYYDGKTLLELTNNEASLVEVMDAYPLSETRESLGIVNLVGEIADPKCFFGVMKPGEGKPHRSCAIRCISGGIPPVLKATNRKGEHNYFILTGPDGETINTEILDKIGVAVELSGQLEQVDDWMVLKLDATSDIKTIHSELLGYVPMCSDQLTMNN